MYGPISLHATIYLRAPLFRVFSVLAQALQNDLALSRRGQSIYTFRSSLIFLTVKSLVLYGDHIRECLQARCSLPCLLTL